MDVGTVLTVAQTLFAALQCSELKEMCSFLGYQSQLDSLEATIVTVKAVLLDAEAKRELSNEAQCYIEKLKDAVYDADDLIDEFVTRAARKQRQLAEGRKVSEKVRLFFSRFKDLRVARNLSRGVKEVRQRLDGIANNHNKFGFKLDSEPTRKRREETCSYVYDKDIIGREVDKEKIVGMLLDSNVKQDVSFLTIVGIGGLGKTTLAQLVYNDEKVTKYFELRLWACVSDEDPKHLDVKAVISKILGSTSSQNLDNSSMERLQGELRQHLSGKKYLLVLDDVWNENRNEWLKLEKFFKEGLVGSWVVVTTRSKETAKVISGSEYDLEGLSEEDSWRLFERIAFGQGEDREKTPELAEIGQTIVKKCANVPLAIRVVASLLYGHGKDKWQSFQETSLGEITKNENGILSILMLSYHNLDSRLKSCFSYCAIFPKDFRIEKKMLISLWRAQGYIVPLSSSQSMEDAAEEYFLILLRRCFFQDATVDAYTGKISSCKMHDLMHDISQKVAGKEVCVLNPLTSDLDRKSRHIYGYPVREHIEGETPFTHKIGIRTWLMCDGPAPIMELHMGALFANWVCLRTLDLHGSGIKILPCSIGNLLHLRYLDLSKNNLKALPKSITKLHNLQTLKLSRCSQLIELPNDFNKLVNLRLLDIFRCCRLTHMPPGMGKLNGLQWLTMFIVGVVDQLEDLKALTNLKGDLQIYIRIPKDVAYVKGNNSYQGGYLSDKQWLDNISFEWGEEEREANEEYEAALFDDLQPHPNLREVRFTSYCGKRLPRWMIESNFGTFFSNLVRISFCFCHGLQQLMSLEKLPHLRELSVLYMMKLEYMEDTRRNTSSHDVGACFFPSLEKIIFQDLPELKGWWRDDDQDQVILDETTASSSLLPSFPRLSDLHISICPKLTRIPLCPNVKNLKLRWFNERLRVIEKKTGRDVTRSPATHSLNSSLPSLSDSGNPKLRVVETDCVRGLMAGLPMEAFQCLTEMTIWNDKEMESLEGVVEVFQSCWSSLHFLKVVNCLNLRRLSYPEQEEGEDDDGDKPWRWLHQSLRSVELIGLPKLVRLPKGMQYLTSLQSLEIRDCTHLESVPEWLPSLTSLTRLEIRYCSKGLMQRCQSPTGEDWPHIKHIPHLVISRQ